MTDHQHAPDPFTVLANYLGIPRDQVMTMTREQLARARRGAAADLSAVVRRGEMHTVAGGGGRDR